MPRNWSGVASFSPSFRSAASPGVAAQANKTTATTAADTRENVDLMVIPLTRLGWLRRPAEAPLDGRLVSRITKRVGLSQWDTASARPPRPPWVRLAVAEAVGSF